MKNIYPITFENFLKVTSVPSGHLVFYTMLDDRIHFEMPIENAVFVTQKFLSSIMEEKVDHILQDPIKIFLKMKFADRTLYKYYPDEEQKAELMNLKLYDRLVTTFADNEELDVYEGQPETIEYDNIVQIMQDGNKILEFKKVL